MTAAMRAFAAAQVASRDLDGEAFPHDLWRAMGEADRVRRDGEKAWVTNGPIADLFIVLAISGRDGERKRYSAYLVPREAPGLEIIATKPLGFLRPSPHCGLQLQAVRVPAA